MARLFPAKKYLPNKGINAINVVNRVAASVLFPQPDRRIAHLDLDTFFVSVERIKNPSLEGQPVMVGSISDRGVVASCSYETRAFGVHAGMPMRAARAACPSAIILRGDYQLYTDYSQMITRIIASEAPLFEKASIDEHYIDVTGLDKFHGGMQWLHMLRGRIMDETGLPISFGLSPNKTVSKIATGQAKPNGFLEIVPQNVAQFLAPLPVQKIPGVGAKMRQGFNEIGIISIADLAAMPSDYMRAAFGAYGFDVWQKANGIDPTNINPYQDRKSISKEHTYLQDTAHQPTLLTTLMAMTEQLGHDLRKTGRLATTISIKIRYANFDTHTRDARINPTSADHSLYQHALHQFGKLHTKRMMIRLIGIKVTGLVFGKQQINMFENTPEMAKLYDALDKLKNKYGEDILTNASAIHAQKSSNLLRLGF